MRKKKVLVLGAGRLAYRVSRICERNGYEATQIDISKYFSPHSHAFEELKDLFRNANLPELAMVYMLDDRDDYNLGLSIALMSVDSNVPISVALFNENIAPHLQASHPNIRLMNPAKIAAPVFVGSINEPVTRFLRYTPAKISIEPRRDPDLLIKMLVLLFIVFIVTVTGYFSMARHISLMDAAYLVLSRVVGSGSSAAATQTIASRMANLAFIFISSFLVWIILSLTIDRIIKRRTELAMGRKRYLYRDHVIVCGLGRLGYFVTEELLKKGERVIIVDTNETSANADHFRNLGVAVYVGDARLPRVLEDVGVARAKAVISVISDDYVNLEIGLNARSFKPDLRVVLRIFDDAMAQELKEHLDIQLAFSMSALADDAFFGTIEPYQESTPPASAI